MTIIPAKDRLWDEIYHGCPESRYLILRHPLLKCWALYDKRCLTLVPAQPTQRQAYERECERQKASIQSALVVGGDHEYIPGPHMDVSFNRYYVRGGEIEHL